MKYCELLKNAQKELEDLAEGTVDAWILFSEAFSMSRAEYFMKMNEEVSQTSPFEEWIELRKTHLPVQYIIKSASFMGYEFFVNEHVLIPRQDTEVLVEEALKLKANKVLDMCTGSGCIAISLELLSGAKVMAVDISKEALKVASINCENLMCTNVDLIESDLFDKIEDKFELIVSNPPYIPTKVIEELDLEVKDHEPLLALDGSEDGLEFYRRLAKESKDYLVSDGSLLMEIGCEQAMDVSNLLEKEGYKEIQVIKDLAGLDRVIKARWR
ncbi:Methylase of polypeptide chain release factor [Lachnospiraceae bacterium TWA4]|nr:Methylase of polypeptide chain release factor [Lachnospiraceae bacterium TWA4]